jgi:phosphatidylglycerol:prolipoprotein diacylglycerol transferase
LHWGPFTITAFGLFAAMGIYLAARITVVQARRAGLDPRPLEDYAPWGVAAGVLCGHLVHLFLYHPEELAGGPLQLLKVWDGLSSFGGLLGGVVAAQVFFYLREVRFSDYADALALGVAPGWAVARVGCFVIHDHPGVRSNFFLAVRFPAGARHDLGLYDALLLGTVAALLHALHRRRMAQRRLLPLLALLYGGARFGLDFLRARDLSYVDARYGGLTPAQYACGLLVLYAIWGWRRGGSQPPTA